LSESWELSLALRFRAQKDNDPQSAEAQTDQGVSAAVTMKKTGCNEKITMISGIAHLVCPSFVVFPTVLQNQSF